MKWIVRLRNWARLVDAPLDRRERRPLTSLGMIACLGIMFVGVVPIVLVFWRIPRLANGFVLAFALLGVVLWIWNQRAYEIWIRSSRLKLGQCRECGFDLRHSRERCPECGATVSDSDRKHMTIRFEATESGTVKGDGFLKVWLASSQPKHMLSLERSTHHAGENEIFMVFDLEPHSTSGKVTSCRLAPESFYLGLTGYFDNRYTQFDIALRLEQTQWNEFAEGIKTLLQGSGSNLIIEKTIPVDSGDPQDPSFGPKLPLGGVAMITTRI
jgi:hypothetical protein